MADPVSELVTPSYFEIKLEVKIGECWLSSLLGEARSLVSEYFIYMTFRTPIYCGKASSSRFKNQITSQDLVYFHRHMIKHI